MECTKKWREKKKIMFWKSRVSVQSFLWKRWKPPWDIYILTEIFISQEHAAKEQSCTRGPGICTAWYKQTEWECWEHFGFHLPPSWDPSQITTHAHKSMKFQVMNVLIYNGYIRWFGFPGPKSCNTDSQLWKTFVKQTAYDSLPKM